MSATLIDELSTVRDYWRWATSAFNRAGLFYGHGTDNAADEALYLLTGALGLGRELDPAMLDARLTREERRNLENLLRRRIDERIPTAYLTGEAWFCGLCFRVDPRVLVPRSPIAELIEYGFQPWLEHEPRRILDLCTGSGCIGIACAYAFAEAEVVLSEVSEDALEVARSNIALHGLEQRVSAVRADLFDGLPPGPFDLIVSNPPYVDADELAAMPAEYRAEPRLGLEAGEDGLALVRRILRGAPDCLAEGGLLVLEVGASAPALEAAFPELPLTWVEFEHGGDGVLVLRREQLLGGGAL